MIKIILALLLCGFALSTIAQPTKIIDTKKQYNASVILNENKELVDVKKLIPTIVLDLKYSTADNFTKTILYKKVVSTYMRKPTANALQQIQNHLLQKGLGIKIFDAYRPYAATKLMWDLIHDERYVANPKNGSNHNRGLAIDLTIINLKTAQELDMGTGFDNFTDTAHHTFINLPKSVVENRQLLKTTMEQFGFKSFDTEWWHYTWPNDIDYEVLDLKFTLLRKVVK